MLASDGPPGVIASLAIAHPGELLGGEKLLEREVPEPHLAAAPLLHDPAARAFEAEPVDGAAPPRLGIVSGPRALHHGLDEPCCLSQLDGGSLLAVRSHHRERQEREGRVREVLGVALRLAQLAAGVLEPTDDRGVDARFPLRDLAFVPVDDAEAREHDRVRRQAPDARAAGDLRAQRREVSAPVGGKRGFLRTGRAVENRDPARQELVDLGQRQLVDGDALEAELAAQHVGVDGPARHHQRAPRPRLRLRHIPNHILDDRSHGRVRRFVEAVEEQEGFAAGEKLVPEGRVRSVLTALLGEEIEDPAPRVKLVGTRAVLPDQRRERAERHEDWHWRKGSTVAPGRCYVGRQAEVGLAPGRPGWARHAEPVAREHAGHEPEERGLPCTRLTVDEEQALPGQDFGEQYAVAAGGEARKRFAACEVRFAGGKGRARPEWRVKRLDARAAGGTGATWRRGDSLDVDRRSALFQRLQVGVKTRAPTRVSAAVGFVDPLAEARGDLRGEVIGGGELGADVLVQMVAQHPERPEALPDRERILIARGAGEIVLLATVRPLDVGVHEEGEHRHGLGG